jgi:hypothetical protein
VEQMHVLILVEMQVQMGETVRMVNTMEKAGKVEAHQLREVTGA